MRSPVRVLHLVDGLGRGGAERWIWDLVRLSDPAVVRHRVVTFFPEDDSFVFADRLRLAGAYSAQAVARKPPRPPLFQRPAARRLFDAMPCRGKRMLWPMIAAFDRACLHASARRRIAAEYVRFRPHIIHGHVFHGMRAGAWLKAWTGLPLAYSVWCFVAQLVDAGAGWVVDDYRRLHRLVDAFFVDAAYRPELAVRGVPDAKMHDVPGSIDLDGVAEYAVAADRHRAEVRSRFSIPADAPIALSVGRLSEFKGHRFVVDALPSVLRCVPNLHWILLGDGDELASLKQAAALHGVADRVRFPGYVENPRPFYAAADLYLRTSVFEGDNTSSQDAMAFGLPVVGFDTGRGTDRIPRVGHGVLVPNRDAGALGAAIVRILLLPDRGRAIGARGREDARAHLDVRRSVDLFTAKWIELHEGRR